MGQLQAPQRPADNWSFMECAEIGCKTWVDFFGDIYCRSCGTLAFLRAIENHKKQNKLPSGSYHRTMSSCLRRSK